MRHLSQSPIVIAVVLAMALFAMFHAGVSGLSGPSPLEPTDQELDVALRLAGIDPEVLCAARVDVMAVAEIVHDGRDALAGRFAQYSTAIEARAAARSRIDRLEPLVRSGKATTVELAELEDARVAFEQHDQAVRAILDDMVAAAVSSLPVQARDRVTMIRSNQRIDCRADYKLAERTAQEWTELRDALNNEANAERYSEPMDPTLEGILGSLRAEPGTSAALLNRTNLPTIEQEWESAVYPD